MPNPNELLEQTTHRPWPVPKQPWLMTQTWRQLLFAHWPVEADAIRPFIPKGLALDTFEGQAWLSIVPFNMDYRLRYSPLKVQFVELNVRTYVVRDGRPGVFFFSLDASDLLTVVAARQTFNLPYFLARMQMTQAQDGFSFISHRRGPKGRHYQFEASYGPSSSEIYTASQPLEVWLTERYCLYSVAQNGNLYRGDVHHLPWPLQRAEADISLNTLLLEHNIILPPRPPILQYTEHLDILVWQPQQLK